MKPGSQSKQTKQAIFNLVAKKGFLPEVFCAIHTCHQCLCFFVFVTCFSVLSKTLPDSALSITCRVFRYVHEDNHKTSILIRTSLFSLPHSKSSGGIYLIIPAKRFCHLQISRLLARDPEESFKALCSMSVHTPYLQPFHRAWSQFLRGGSTISSD